MSDKINAIQIRPGNVIVYKKDLYAVHKISHTQPGKGGAYVQVEMKGIKNGTKLNERFRSGETIEKAFLDDEEYQFLFKDNDEITLMNLSNYEQVVINSDVVGEPYVFLNEGMKVTLTSYENIPVSVALPEEVILEVVEADAVVKGQTASSSNKPAVLSNGVRIMVPPFIESGEMVIVKTADAAYVKKAN